MKKKIYAPKNNAEFYMRWNNACETIIEEIERRKRLRKVKSIMISSHARLFVVEKYREI